MPFATTNYGWTLPDAGAEPFSWEPFVRTAFQGIDTTMFSKFDKAGGTITGATSVQGRLTSTHATPGDNNVSFANTSATGYGMFCRGGGGANYAALFVDYSAGNVLGTLSGVGDWTVAGTASFATTNCRIASNGNVTNLNGVYGTISERRFKNVLGLATPKLQKILELAALVCNYTLVDDPKQIKQIGLIVDEVESISPGLIFTEPVLEPVQDTRTIQRQATERRTVSKHVLTVQGGQVVATVQQVEVDVPLFDNLPVVDADGQPVVGIDGVQLTYKVPVMVDVPETFTEMRDLGNVRKGIKWSIVVPMLLKAFGEMHGDFDARLKEFEAGR